jgi:hypothetical protein
MRLALLSAALIAFAATPAAAQVSISGIPQASASQRERAVSAQRGAWEGQLAQIDRRADRAEDDGAISRREERSIHRQTSLVRALGARYAASGLTDAELSMLEAQAFALRDLSQAPNRPIPPRRGH